MFLSDLHFLHYLVVAVLFKVVPERLVEVLDLPPLVPPPPEEPLGYLVVLHGNKQWKHQVTFSTAKNNYQIIGDMNEDVVHLKSVKNK